MIDEARARGLQTMYASGATGALEALQEECTAIAQSLVRIKRPGISQMQSEQIAHDAAGSLIERYLRDPLYRVRRFAKSLDFLVSAELRVDPRCKQLIFESRTILASEYFYDKRQGWDGTIYDFPDLSEHVTVSVMIEDGAQEIAEAHTWGKKAVADLCRSRSYREAIRRISAYVERRWIYDHAAAFHDVFCALHWKAGQKKGGLSRTGLGAVRRSLLQKRRSEFLRSDE